MGRITNMCLKKTIFRNLSFYSDFCKKELNKESFSRKVHRLNLNILFLCIMQNVSPRSLSLVCTLTNIINMLNTDITDLGRIGPVNVLTRSVQDFINHNDLHIDLVGDDSETDGNLILNIIE